MAFLVIFYEIADFGKALSAQKIFCVRKPLRQNQTFFVNNRAKFCQNPTKWLLSSAHLKALCIFNPLLRYIIN